MNCPSAALNTLEKVALMRAKRRGKPSVLVINNVHHFNNNEEGRNTLLQLQQRAELWAACGKPYSDQSRMSASNFYDRRHYDFGFQHVSAL